MPCDHRCVSCRYQQALGERDDLRQAAAAAGAAASTAAVADEGEAAGAVADPKRASPSPSHGHDHAPSEENPRGHEEHQDQRHDGQTSDLAVEGRGVKLAAAAAAAAAAAGEGGGSLRRSEERDKEVLLLRKLVEKLQRDVEGLKSDLEVRGIL